LHINFAATEGVERRVRRDGHDLAIELMPDRDGIALTVGATTSHTTGRPTSNPVMKQPECSSAF
jgi:hypothetical protein